ncbi:MAG: hypothetical protein J3R72DRAFT_427254 [Linnemannia gamsii]|nr:MAG: hypothetical protein J3R72DRAFT_427254 [Linnemannia gamsii]
MLKSLIILGFALVASTTNAASAVSFYKHPTWQGAKVNCPGFNEYDKCYSVNAGIGMRSGEYVNEDPHRSKFSLTVYSGPACNGMYDRWSFTRAPFSKRYGFDFIPTLKDNIQSFKVAAFHTSMVSGGYAGLNPEHTVPSGCQ